MSEPKPVLIYDGHCGFCRIWLDYWRQLTGDRIEYLASQEVGDRFPQIPREAYSAIGAAGAPRWQRGQRRARRLRIARQGAYLLLDRRPQRIRLPHHRPPSGFLLSSHSLHLRHAHRAHALRRDPVAVSACTGAYLRHRLRIARVPGHRPLRGARHPPGGAVSRVGRANRFRAAFSRRPQPLLVRQRRHHAHRTVLCRRGIRRHAVAHRLRAREIRAPHPSLALHLISVVRRGRPGVSLLPMGFAAARSRISGDLPGPQPHRAVAIPLAGVPFVFPFGRRQTAEWRSHLAQSLRGGLPLAHAAAADRRSPGMPTNFPPPSSISSPPRR